MDELITTLIDAGFSEKEAQIYIALLAHGTATVSEVAERTHINRSTAQVALEALLEKRVVLEDIHDARANRYSANSPEVVVELVHEQVERVAITEERIATLLPALRVMNHAGKGKPSVKIADQRSGLVEFLTRCVMSKEKCFRVVAAMTNFLSIVSKEEYELFVIARKNMEVSIRSIYPDNETTRMMQKDHNRIDEQVFIPSDSYKLTYDIGVTDATIAYMSPNVGGEGILIESQEIADSMKSLYDLAMIGARNIPGAVYLPRAA